MPTNAIDLFNRIGQVDDTAQEVGIRPELLHAVMHQESGGNANAVSPKGAVGLMQTMPQTAKDPGFGVKPFNPNNPDENLRGGASYLKAMLDRYPGDEAKALAAYNAGPGTVDKAGGVPNIPETQQYVQNILGRAVPIEANPVAPPQAPAAAPPKQSAIDLFNSLGEDQKPETPQAAVERLATERAAPADEGGVMKFAKGAWENLNPIAAVKGVMQAAQHPIDTGKALLQAQKDQFGKAKQDYQQGHYSEMVGHGLAGALPIVGPAAAKAGEDIGKGEIAKGLGEGAGLIGSVVAPEIAAKTIRGVGNLEKVGAERIIRSNVKPDMSLVKRNPTVNIARTILDENLGPGKRGVNKATGIVGDLSDQVSGLTKADAATGKTYDLAPLEQALMEKRAHYLQSPAGADNVAAIDGALKELRNHPLYSQEVVTQPGIPGTTMAEEMSGYPKRPAVPEIIDRQLQPQDAATIDKMKRGIYEENPTAYGERKGAAVEGDKAQGRALKGILDANVDGVKDLNARQSKVIVAKKALTKMAEREANKYPLGLMDLGASVAAATGAAINPVFAIPPVLVALLKHPTTAFPIAKTLDLIGKTTQATAPVAKAAGVAGTVGVQGDTALRNAILNKRQP